MAADEGPTAFFHFAPDAPAGLTRRTPLALSPQNFTFATWLRLEADAAGAVGGAPLLALYGGDPDGTAPPPPGVAVLLRGGRLVVAAFAHGAHQTALGGACALAPREWHHVAVTIETPLLAGASTVTAHLDGKRIESESLRVARVDAVEFTAVAAAGAVPAADWPEPLEPLRAQLGTVHLFDTALTSSQARPAAARACRTTDAGTPWPQVLPLRCRWRASARSATATSARSRRPRCCCRRSARRATSPRSLVAPAPARPRGRTSPPPTCPATRATAASSMCPREVRFGQTLSQSGHTILWRHRLSARVQRATRKRRARALLPRGCASARVCGGVRRSLERCPGAHAPVETAATLLPGTRTLLATRPRHLLDAVGGVVAVLPLFLAAALPALPPPSGHLAAADEAAVVAASELPAGAGGRGGWLEAARRGEELALREYAAALRADHTPSARLLDAISTLQVRVFLSLCLCVRVCVCVCVRVCVPMSLQVGCSTQVAARCV